MIYFDNNATTQISNYVYKIMQQHFDVYQNPSAAYSIEVKEAIALARKQVARLINCEPDEIIFTSSGTEANNTMLNIFRNALVASDPIEHKSILCPLQDKQAHYFHVTKEGHVTPDDVLFGDIRLITIMLANNEIGTIQDLTEFAGRGIWTHTDATQALGKIPIDVKKLNVDYMTLSAHKIHGPKGIGALYVRRGAPFKPFLLGGLQEDGRRAGTENFLGIVGFGSACANCDPETYAKQVSVLKKHLEVQLSMSIPDVQFNHPPDGLPNTLSVTIPKVNATTLAMFLEAQEIYVSAGAACNTGSILPSHVLKAIDADIEHTIRITLDPSNTIKEIDIFMEKLCYDISRIAKNSR